MKKVLVLILAFCLMAGLAACGTPSDNEIKEVRNVSFEGTELTVTLGTNKSTGFEWEHEIYGKCIEPSVNRSFKVTGSNGDATGEVSIGFEGTSAGTAVIVFTTPNGWDGTGEGDSYTVNVEVDADGTIVSADGSEGANAPEPTSKISVAIDELKEGTYTGTMSGDEHTSVQEGTDDIAICTTTLPADITVTIESGQITLYCEATASSYGMLQDVKTPQTPDYSRIVSGSLPLQQSGDAVTAEGKVPSLGHIATLHYTDGVFDRWEIKESGEDDMYTCSVHIAMENGIPVAAITVGKTSPRTATVPLALDGESTN